MSSRNSSEPIFSRGDVAKILNVTALTVANREKRDQYPDPKRDLNNYRTYTLNDVLNLQLLTYSAIDTRPIMSLLYDKGWRDMRHIGQLMDTALSRRGMNR